MNWNGLMFCQELREVSPIWCTGICRFILFLVLFLPLESQKYCTVHCTGYMRSWPTSQLGAEGEGEADKHDSSHFSCLVAVGRVHSQCSPQVNGEVQVKPTEFITRYAMDGKFTFVDQR